MEKKRKMKISLEEEWNGWRFDWVRSFISKKSQNIIKSWDDFLIN